MKKEKGRNKLLIEDDRWKRKGGPMGVRRQAPAVCQYCFGVGTWRKVRCQVCGGSGEIWK